MKGTNGKQRFANYLSVAVIVIALVFLSLALLALLWPYKICEVSNVRMITLKTQVGGLAVFAFHFEKYKNLPGDYTISLRNGAVYTLTSGQTFSPVGTFDTQKSVLISPEVAPGKYHISVSMLYHPNPIRTVRVDFQTLDMVEIFE